MNDNSIKVMKLNVLDSHDRLVELNKKEALNIAQGAEDCLKKNPLSLAIQEKSPYIYIFAHPRTESDGIKKRMLWQPRLSRPYPQTNSYLFRANSKSDVIEICWMLPPMELWSQYKKGLITENPTVEWSINMFLHSKSELAKNHPEDMSDERSKSIYMKIAEEMQKKNVKPKIEEVSSSYSWTQDSG